MDEIIKHYGGAIIAVIAVIIIIALLYIFKENVSDAISGLINNFGNQANNAINVSGNNIN